MPPPLEPVSLFRGPVRLMRELRADVSGFPAFAFNAYAIARGPGLLGGQVKAGTGVSFNRDRARVGAIGEAIERMAMAEPDGLSIHDARWTDVASRAPHPQSLAPHASEELARFKALKPFDESALLGWLSGTRIVDGAERLIPLGAVFPDTARRLGQWWAPLMPNSHASGLTREGAIVHALVEAVERDALMLAWAQRTIARRLDLDAVAADRAGAAKAVAAARNAQLEIVVGDLTSDIGLPVCCAAILDASGRGPRIVTGTGAGFDGAAAAERAIEEAIQMRLRTVQLHRRGGEKALGRFARWWNGDPTFAIDRLMGSPEEMVETTKRSMPDDDAGKINALAKLLARVNVSPIVVET
ncbi:MAG TPA: YcaO-like family protein, partial [Burkholderiales bacterium]|nr:YcaO-like family protein [Burkholderiales bacterium]